MFLLDKFFRKSLKNGLFARLSYICPRTLFDTRQKIIELNLYEKMFNDITKKLAELNNVDFGTARLDSTQIKSNMRSMSRLTLFVSTIEKLLRSLNRHHQELYSNLDEKYHSKYLKKSDSKNYFAQSKPSQSKRSLSEARSDAYDLIELFKNNEVVSNRTSYKLLKRLLNEQCEIKDYKIQLKSPEEVASNSLQNPSDPDAGYSGHKGTGYQVQIMETCNNAKREGGDSLNLITHVQVESADKQDCDALVPALDKSKKAELAPTEKILADTPYI